MRVVGLVVVGMLALPAAASACPWAGNTYKMGGNISDLLFNFDDACAVVKISRVTSPSKSLPVKMVQKKRHWTATLKNGLEFSFSKDGRSARMREGGYSARLAVSKQN